MTGKIQKQLTEASNIDINALQIIFEIDPSFSKVQNEHMLLAQYLNNSYLNIDMYDADSRFLYATTKIPL